MQRASYRKHHITYKTICLVSGRYYLGLHSTDDLNDGYLGSGRRLVNSIKKHGRDQHVREILVEHLSRKEASDHEVLLITHDVRKDPMCMNCGAGGLGATDRSATKEETRAKLSKASKAFTRTKEHYEKVVATRKAKNNYGHSVETKAEMSKQRKGMKLTEQHKLNISIGGQGHEVTQETREKISNSNRLNNELGLRKKPATRSEEHRERLRQAALAQHTRARLAKYSEQT